jgi:hypothetical protein
VNTFTETEHDIGKKYTVGIEGRADCGIGIGVFSGRRTVFQKSDSSIGKYLMRHSFTSMKVIYDASAYFVDHHPDIMRSGAFYYQIILS